MKLPVYAKVDLTTGRWERFEISREYFKKYVGGKCLAARLLLNLTEPGLGPLDERAVIVVNTGRSTARARRPRAAST